MHGTARRGMIDIPCHLVAPISFTRPTSCDVLFPLAVLVYQRLHRHWPGHEEMTIEEIMLGKGDYYPGLVPLVYAYLGHIGCDADTMDTVDQVTPTATAVQSYAVEAQGIVSGDLPLMGPNDCSEVCVVVESLKTKRRTSPLRRRFEVWFGVGGCIASGWFVVFNRRR